MDGSTLLLVRGLVGLAIGIVAIAWPGITIAVLVTIFGVYAVIDGITNLMLGLRRSKPQGRSWPQVVQGIAGMLIGVLTFVWPGVTALALVMLIGAWAAVTGIFEIVAAIRLRKILEREWLLVLSGVLSVLFGLLIFAFPAVGAVSIAWLLGLYAAAAGAVLVVLAVRVRSVALLH